MVTKNDKLNKLDGLLLDKMIGIMESGETELLPELTSVISYLKGNNLTEDKQSSTIEEEIKLKVKEANDRRESKKSKQ